MHQQPATNELRTQAQEMIGRAESLNELNIQAIFDFKKRKGQTIVMQWGNHEYNISAITIGSPAYRHSNQLEYKKKLAFISIGNDQSRQIIPSNCRLFRYLPVSVYVGHARRIKREENIILYSFCYFFHPIMSDKW